MLARMKFHEKGKMKSGTKRGLYAAVTLSLCELCQKHVGNWFRVQSMLTILRTLSSMLSNCLDVYEPYVRTQEVGLTVKGTGCSSGGPAFHLQHSHDS